MYVLLIFWLIFSGRLNKRSIPSMIDGLGDDSDITETFASRFRSLYSCVPTSEDELSDIRNRLSMEVISNQDIHYGITVPDVTECLARLKDEKSDGLRGTTSDHYIYCSHQFKVYYCNSG